MSGVAYLFKPTLFSSISKKFIFIEKGKLYSQPLTFWFEKPTGEPTLECHLNRIIHLSQTQGIFPNNYTPYSFQLTTKGEVFHFNVRTEEEMLDWLNHCTPNIYKNVDNEDDYADFTCTPVQDEMMVYYGTIYRRYVKCIT